MKKLRTIWIQGIVFSLCPALCAWLGQSNILEQLQEKQYIGTEIPVAVVKECFAFLGVISTVLLLTCPLIVAQLNERKYHLQRDRLIKNNKETLFKVLSNILHRERCDIDIRIFVPQNDIIHRIIRKIDKRQPLYFVIKNLEGLAEPGLTSDLKFEVYPNQQGLVGRCYQSRGILYDDDLEQSNETEYNLNTYQINKTSDLKFILVCPILGFDGSIKAIVAFDSKTKMEVTDENKKNLTNAVLNYTQELYELVPEFFK